MRRLEKGLGIAGLIVLVFSISFVRGAMEENEPEAAAQGSQIFGGTALTLALLATAVAWLRRRD